MRKKIRSKKFGVIGSARYIGKPSPKLEKAIVKMAEIAYLQTSVNKLNAETEKMLNEFFATPDSKQIKNIENYIFGLLRRHTKYLIQELALSQYPEKVLFDTTEKFIKNL